MTQYMYCRGCNTEREGVTCWKCASALEAVKHENWHPLEMPPLEKIRELAKECGYACAVHGSQERDLDVVLVAWTEEALKRNYQEVMHYIAAGLIAENGLPARVVEIEAKPLGRHACTIQMNGWYKAIDLSVAAFIAPKLGDEEALKILEGAGWFDPRNADDPTPDWDSQSVRSGRPHMNALGIKNDEPFVILDGSFTRDQLLALLHFHPENKQ